MSTRLITLAQEKDVADIVELNQQLHEDWRDQKWISATVTRHEYYVIREDKSVTAAMALSRHETELCIETLAVNSSLQKAGRGKMLVEFAVKKAKQFRKESLTVDSFCSRGLYYYYHKMGFKLNSPALGIYKGMPFYSFVMYI